MFLGLVSSGQRWVGAELFSDVVHQFLQSRSISHSAAIELGIISDFSDKNLDQVNFPVFIQSGFLIFLSTFL